MLHVPEPDQQEVETLQGDGDNTHLPSWGQQICSQKRPICQSQYVPLHHQHQPVNYNELKELLQ